MLRFIYDHTFPAPTWNETERDATEVVYTVNEEQVYYRARGGRWCAHSVSPLIYKSPDVLGCTKELDMCFLTQYWKLT